MPSVQKWWHAPLLACALVLVVLVYLPGFPGGFVFDDYPNLVAEHGWRLTSLDPESLARLFGTGFSGWAGRPLAMLSFGLDHYANGLSPAAMKATNVGMHVVNALLVALLCQGLFAHLRMHDRERLGMFAAIAVAATWAMHPLQASTVLYIVQRMEIGATTGILLALLAYLRARMTTSPRAAACWALMSVAAVVLGTGFKETALLAPAFALAVEVCVLRFASPRGGTSRRLVGAWAVAVGIALLGFLAVAAPHYLASPAWSARGYGASERVTAQGPVLLTYIAQILVPDPDSHLFYYDHLSPPTSLASPLRTLGAWLALVAILGVGWAARHRFPLTSLGILWFFCGHLLTSNIVPLELAFEHRNYLALLGLVLASVQPLAAASARFHLDARRTAAAVVVACIAFAGVLQTSTWSDPFRLATTLASRNVASARASYELGRLLLERSGGDPRNAAWDLARKEFTHASEVGRTSPMAEQALVIMAGREGGSAAPAVWERLRSRYAGRPILPEGEAALWQLVECRQTSRCPAAIDAPLLATFGTALDANPDSARVHSMYATFAFSVLGDRDLGIRVMRDAVALAPRDPQFRANLARFLLVNGDRSGEADRLEREVRAANGSGQYDDDLMALEKLRASAGG